jgi:hypothetical protein
VSDLHEILREGFMGNVTTLRNLQLMCGYSNTQAAEVCCVSVETYRRWRRDRTPNRAAVRLLAIFAGYLPWDGWRGWEMQGGYLFPPGFERHGIAPGEVITLPYWRQLAKQLQRDLTRLRESDAGAKELTTCRYM